MTKTAVTVKQGLCFICSEEAEGEIYTARFFYANCHKDCWDQACCNLIKFPEGFISCEEFKKVTGIDISYICRIFADETKEWILDDKLHREDGPAYEGADGTTHWYLDGKCHREEGPAIERANGLKEWYLDGRQFSEQDHTKEMKKINQFVKKKKSVI